MKKVVFALGLVAAIAVQPQTVEAQTHCLLGACWSGGQFTGSSTLSGSIDWNRSLRDWLNRFDGWDGRSFDWDALRNWTPGPVVRPVRPRNEAGVSEPGTLFLLLAGVSGLALVGWHRREELFD